MALLVPWKLEETNHCDNHLALVDHGVDQRVLAIIYCQNPFFTLIQTGISIFFLFFALFSQSEA